MTNQEAFAMLREYALDSRGLRLNYFPDWEEDIRETDQSLRSILSDRPDYESLRESLRSLEPEEILSLRDYTAVRIILLRGDGERDFYSIGPFRSHPFHDDDFRILRSICPGISETNFLRSLVSPVPTNIPEIEALTLAQKVLLYFRGISRSKVRTVDLTAGSRTQERLGAAGRAGHAVPRWADESIRRVEEVYRHQDRLMDAVTSGNYSRALQEAQFFAATPPVAWSIPDRKVSMRNMLLAADTTCRLAAQRAGVHPVFLDDISQRYNQKFSSSLTEEAMTQTYLEMLEEYCRICREDSTSDCSPALQKIRAYIHLHLSGDLSLETISRGVNFSTSYILRKFREELHTTPGAYITARRIRAAKQLLLESDMPIHEVSQYVGIGDWNYFSKVFRRETGVSPTEFRAGRSRRTE